MRIGRDWRSADWEGSSSGGAVRSRDQHSKQLDGRRLTTPRDGNLPLGQGSRPLTPTRLAEPGRPCPSETDAGTPCVASPCSRPCAAHGAALFLNAYCHDPAEATNLNEFPVILQLTFDSPIFLTPEESPRIDPPPLGFSAPGCSRSSAGNARPPPAGATFIHTCPLQTGRRSGPDRVWIHRTCHRRVHLCGCSCDHAMRPCGTPIWRASASMAVVTGRAR